jgi:dTMP kinase
MRARLSRIKAAATGWRPPETQPGARALPGWFIAIEGGDGTGKTTQIDALARWLRKRGFDVVTTREPGATVLGAKLREILLHTKDREPVGARAEALLFAADRADHVEKVVRPALERGAIVLTDRHVDSSIAYQSGGRQLPADEIAALSAFATEGLRPDLVVLLDLDPAVAWERAQARGDAPDRVEAEPTEFHRRVREVFRSRAAAEPARYLVVDATEPAGVITAIVQDRLENLLPLSAREIAEAKAREKALREAKLAEQREQEARLAAERAAAEETRQRRLAAEAAARQEEEKRREEARAEQARKAAEERARQERQREEERRREEAERRAAELRDAQRREQEAADAEHRRQIELTVRQVEAKAKGLARQQAERELRSRALSAQTQQKSEPKPETAAERAGGDPAEANAEETAAHETSTQETTTVEKTAVLHLDLEPTQVLHTATGGHGHRVDPGRVSKDLDEDFDDDDDAPRSRWRLSLGKRKS